MKNTFQHTNLNFIAWNQTNATGFLCGKNENSDYN